MEIAVTRSWIADAPRNALFQSSTDRGRITARPRPAAMMSEAEAQPSSKADVRVAYRFADSETATATTKIATVQSERRRKPADGSVRPRTSEADRTIDAPTETSC